MPYSYRTLTETLTRAGIEEAGEEALLLLEHFMGISRVSVMLDRDHMYTSSTLDEAVTRRLTRYPLQYILGTWNFFGCTFEVNEHCLIPRPDTEILVEEAIRILPSGARVVDLCTGSGCIAVATLYHRPDVAADALELYPDTLAIAVKNAVANQVDERFSPIRADLLQEGLLRLTARAPYDAILSNPPYIRTADISPLSPEVHHEPFGALDGGEDGLLFYRVILRDYASLVKPGGHILLEIGYDQAADVCALAQQFLPGSACRVVRDLGGRDRVIIITMA